MERSRSRTSPQDEPSQSFLCRSSLVAFPSLPDEKVFLQPEGANLDEVSLHMGSLLHDIPQLVVVVEMSHSSLLAHAVLPGEDRRSMKKLPVDEVKLLAQLNRWHDEAEKKIGCAISRICVAYEAGQDEFWLARYLRDNGIDVHATTIPVKRDHRRAKTDRLDCLLLMRAFLGWRKITAGWWRSLQSRKRMLVACIENARNWSASGQS